MLPPQLRPPLHVQHASSWPSINTTEPGSRSPRTPPPPSRGVKSQPAKGGQFLTGADTLRVRVRVLRTTSATPDAPHLDSSASPTSDTQTHAACLPNRRRAASTNSADLTASGRDEPPSDPDELGECSHDLRGRLLLQAKQGHPGSIGRYRVLMEAATISMRSAPPLAAAVGQRGPRATPSRGVPLSRVRHEVARFE